MINKARAWAKVHQRTLGVFIATCLATIFGFVYTNYNEDHVERQKEFVLVNNMQDDIQEIKIGQRQSNEMMANFIRSNTKHDVEIQQIEKRVENIERIVYAPKK